MHHSDVDARRVVNVRRALHKLRQRWEQHTPVAPFCMTEELDEGVTYGEFCVEFLLSHRSRRLPRSKVESPPENTLEVPPTKERLR